MIRFERARLPRGARAFALREDGAIVVQVAAGLTARERLAVIREALRAAPAAGWRSPRSPVLLPALAGCAGLRKVPEGRWAYRAAAVAMLAVLLAASLTAVSLHQGGARPPAAVQPGSPLQAGPGPAPGQPAAGQRPGAGHQHGARTGPGPARPGQAPGAAPKPARTTTTSAGGPAPEASGTPAPVPTASPSPNPPPSPGPSPSPSPSPSPAKQSGSSGTCLDLLGVTLCL
jgi:hypothetical protein